MSPRRLQDALKTYLQDVFKRCLQDVFSVTTFHISRRICKTSSWKTENCYAEDALKTFSRHVLKTSWRPATNVCYIKNTIDYFKILVNEVSSQQFIKCNNINGQVIYKHRIYTMAFWKRYNYSGDTAKRSYWHSRWVVWYKELGNIQLQKYTYTEIYRRHAISKKIWKILSLCHTTSRQSLRGRRMLLYYPPPDYYTEKPLMMTKKSPR